MITTLVLRLIRLYQKTFSPDHSPWGRTRHPYGFCRFFPSCSEYAHQTIYQNGLLSGSAKALWRILRCNPFSRGGIDPVR